MSGRESFELALRMAASSINFSTPKADMQTFEGSTQFGLPLTGHDKASLDSRGRIAVPKAMRDGLGEKFVVMIGRKGCLEAVSTASFARIWSEIERHSPHSEARQDYAVAIMSNSWTVEFDKTGRFVVPEKAQTASALKQELLLRSRGDAVEIWGVEEFAKYEQDEDGYKSEKRKKMKDLRRRMLEDDQS